MIRNNNTENQLNRWQNYLFIQLRPYIGTNDVVDICKVLNRNGLRRQDEIEFMKLINTHFNGGLTERYINHTNKHERNIFLSYYASHHQQTTLNIFENFISDNHNDIGNNGQIFAQLRNAIQVFDDNN